MVVVATSQYLRFAAQFRILLQGPQKDMPKARRVRGWKCLFTEWILGSLADFQDTVLWRLSVVVIKQLYKYILRFSTSIFQLDEIFSARFFIVLFQFTGWVRIIFWRVWLPCIMVYSYCTLQGAGMDLDQWVLIYNAEMFTLVWDGKRDQNSSFPIVPVPFPVLQNSPLWRLI